MSQMTISVRRFEPGEQEDMGGQGVARSHEYGFYGRLRGAKAVACTTLEAAGRADCRHSLVCRSSGRVSDPRSDKVARRREGGNGRGRCDTLAEWQKGKKILIHLYKA